MMSTIVGDLKTSTKYYDDDKEIIGFLDQVHYTLSIMISNPAIPVEYRQTLVNLSSEAAFVRRKLINKMAKKYRRKQLKKKVFGKISKFASAFRSIVK